MPPKKQKDEDELDLKELLGLETTSKKKTKRELSEEQKQVLRDRLVKMREIAKEKREAKKKNVSFEKDQTSGENVIIKPKDNMDNIFEKQYKDKFEMLSEKLNLISSDVVEMKQMKLKKQEEKRKALEAKRQEEEDKKNQLDLEKQRENELKQQASQKPTQEPTNQQPIIQKPDEEPLTISESINNEPAPKLSFRQDLRVLNIKYYLLFLYYIII